MDSRLNYQIAAIRIAEAHAAAAAHAAQSSGSARRRRRRLPALRAARLAPR
jgi:hypothetical protein